MAVTIIFSFSLNPLPLRRTLVTLCPHKVFMAVADAGGLVAGKAAGTIAVAVASCRVGKKMRDCLVK